MKKHWLILISAVNVVMLCCISHISRNSLPTYANTVFERSYMANMTRNNLCDTASTTWDKIRTCITDTCSYILVLRFTDDCCTSCVLSATELLNKYAAEIGYGNICIMGYRRNQQLFKSEIEELKLSRFKCVNIRKLDIPVEGLRYPYFFVVDSALNVSHVFIPDKQYNIHTNEYLQGIARYIANN